MRTYKKWKTTAVILAGILACSAIPMPTFGSEVPMDSQQTEQEYAGANKNRQINEAAVDPDPVHNDPLYPKKAENNEPNLVGDAIENNLIHDKRFSQGYQKHYGVDVSRYEGAINWKKVKESGKDFAIIRMGYRASGNGVIYEDPTGKRNLRDAVNAGLRVGVYIFSQALDADEAREEADWLYDSVSGYENQIEIPYVMDYEYVGSNQGRLYRAKLTRAEASDCVNAFVSEIGAKGKKAMLYANTNFLADQVNTSLITSNCDYWVARYASAANYRGPYTYWQYSDTADVEGVASDNCDVDVWYEAVGSSNTNRNNSATGNNTATEAMYRLYNPNSGEHFYTASAGERDRLAKIGWKDEGTAWTNPKEGISVYRLYNPNSGEHHYTTNVGERSYLIKIGWKDEGVGWHAAASGTPVYRLYNPNATGAGAHHYTTNAGERSQLIKIGWHDEGIGWNAV